MGCALLLIIYYCPRNTGPVSKAARCHGNSTPSLPHMTMQEKVILCVSVRAYSTSICPQHRAGDTEKANSHAPSSLLEPPSPLKLRFLQVLEKQNNQQLASLAKLYHWLQPGFNRTSKHFVLTFNLLSPLCRAVAASPDQILTLLVSLLAIHKEKYQNIERYVA